MKKLFPIIVCLCLLACTSKTSSESEKLKPAVKMDVSDLPTSIKEQAVDQNIKIEGSAAEVWKVITGEEYAKILGAEFAEHAFVESEWVLNAKVFFKYEPDEVVSAGDITVLEENEYIQVDYDFSGFKYTERYCIVEEEKGASLHIFAGPYTQDLEAQKVVWNNWLAKVKELVEAG